MNREDMKKALTILSQAYPHIRIENKALTLQIWEAQLSCLESEAIFKAIEYHIAHSNSWPTIARMKELVAKNMHIAMQTAIEVPVIDSGEDENPTIEDDEIWQIFGRDLGF